MIVVAEIERKLLVAGGIHLPLATADEPPTVAG